MGKEDYVSVPLYDNEAFYPVKATKTTVSPKTKSAPPARSSSAWCCVKILLGLFVVFAVVPFCFFTVVFITGYVYMADKVKQVTVTDRHVLPIVTMPESELEMVDDRFTLFWNDLAVDRIPPVPTVIITADEMNGFIAQSDYLRGNMYVQVGSDQLTIETSLPLAQSYLPGSNGRYFVSTTTLVAATENTLSVDIEAPIDVFQGQLVKGLFQFSMDKDNKHHVMNMLYGKAFGMEPEEEFYEEKNNILDFFDDDNDETSDFLRAIDNLATIKFLPNQIVFTARIPVDDGPEGSSSETTTSRLSPWHLLRRLF